MSIIRSIPLQHERNYFIEMRLQAPSVEKVLEK